MENIAKVKQLLQGEKILILGLGREGRSTYLFIRNLMPNQHICIADANPDAFTGWDELGQDKNITISHGPNYLNALYNCEIAIKSPGISLKDIDVSSLPCTITCQVELFLQTWGHKCIGITGTKGKSTTASLVAAMLQQQGINCLLAGNIGVPVLDMWPQMQACLWAVLELSSHQLEFCQASPAIALLTNIFAEHLDHYRSFSDYAKAKFNIARYQKAGNHFFYNETDEYTNKFMPTGLLANLHPLQPLQSSQISSWQIQLPGQHNRFNVYVAYKIAALAGVSANNARLAAQSFTGLAHRLQRVSVVNGVEFWNDSISTVPQATIAALAAVPQTAVLLLGGADRGIDYSAITNWLANNTLTGVVFLGKAGLRMHTELNNRFKGKTLVTDDFAQAVTTAATWAKPGQAVLLSPAAASYGYFSNFIERGNEFTRLVEQLQA